MATSTAVVNGDNLIPQMWNLIVTQQTAINGLVEKLGIDQPVNNVAQVAQAWMPYIGNKLSSITCNIASGTASLAFGIIKSGTGQSSGKKFLATWASGLGSWGLYNYFVYDRPLLSTYSALAGLTNVSKSDESVYKRMIPNSQNSQIVKALNFLSDHTVSSVGSAFNRTTVAITALGGAGAFAYMAYQKGLSTDEGSLKEASLYAASAAALTVVSALTFADVQIASQH